MEKSMAHRRSIAALFLGCVTAGLLCQSASSQTSRNIRLIVPVPPGASTDVVARLMADHISRAHGVTMVVENRPGASGMIGTELVSRATPDGNTLLMTANTYLIGESKYVVADVWSNGTDNRGLWSGGVYLDKNWRYYANLAAAVEPFDQPAIGADYTGSTPRTDQTSGGRTFGSFHTGGVNMAFGDGSVRLMSVSTDVNIHRELGTIADGLPVGGFNQ